MTTEATGAAGASDTRARVSSLQVQPYLFFNGRCEEAIEFYRRTLGAELLMLLRFKDSPEPPMAPPISGDKVMHASFRIGETVVMASDGCYEVASFQGFSLALSVPDDAAAERSFAALAGDGKVQQPLIKTFFASRFGMLVDRFGVSWMVTVT